MGKTIDQKVVELGFENDKFQTGVKDSLTSIDALKKGLDFQGATKGLKQIDDQAGRVNFGHMANGIDDIKNRFSVMGAVAFTIIQDMTRGIINFGKQIANTLVLDPIKMGFSEYETKMNAIQTILANTSKAGVTLEDVTDVLDDLNTYADKTIYNFTEMTKNIGTFTAAGIDLDTSAAAIKGIANLAAVSGSNSQQASTAMYQLSQALSSGTLKLQDWNSVVNAGMGGQVFQDALKETARVHGIAVDDLIEQNGSFRESLQEGWITKDILTETLSKFTGDLTEAQLVAMGYAENQVEEILKLGQVANDAATKVKTLTQLGDTLKEAMQSGWTQSWEILIGDFNEAKELLTEVSDVLGGLIGTSAEARNALLQEWKDLGGRDSIIHALWNAFDGLLGLLKPIKEAFQEIFPPITAQRLYEFTKRIEEFTEKFKMGESTLGEIKRVFLGIFSALDIGRMLITSFGKEFVNFLRSFEGGSGFIGDAVGKIADFLINLRNTIKEGKTFDGFFANMFKVLRTAIDSAREGIKAFVDKMKESKTLNAVFKILGGTVLVLAKAIEWLYNAFRGLGGGIDWGPVKQFFAELKEGLKIDSKIKDFFANIKNSFSGVGKEIGPKAEKIVEGIKNVRNAIVEWLQEKINKLDAGKVLDVVNKGLLGSLLLALKGFIKDGQSILGGGLFVVFLKEVTSFVQKGGMIFENVSGILDGVKDTLKAYQQELKSKTLLRVAAAIAILALAIIALTFIDPQKLTLATVAIAAMFAALIATMDTMGAITKDNPKKLGVLAASLLVVSVAILILAGAIKKMSVLTPEETAQGVAAIIGMLTALGVFINAHKQGTGLAKTAIGVLIMAVALRVLAGVMAKLGALPGDQVAQGLLLLSAAMALIAAATHAMPKNIPGMAIGLLLMSAALVVLAGVLERLGRLKIEEVQQGLLALAGLLGILALGLNLMSGTLGGSASLLIAAAALVILAGALKTLGSMKLEQIGIALLAVVGVFAVLGVAGMLLAPVVPVLLGLGAAMLLLGLAALGMGVGIAAFSVGLASLAVSGAAGAAGLAILVTTMAKLLPFVAEQIGLAIVSLIETIAASAPRILQAMLTLLATGLEALSIMIPKIVETVLVLVQTLLEAIAEHLPSIVQAGFDILVGFLDGIAQNLPLVVAGVVDVIAAFLRAIGEETPKVVEAGWDMLISFIDGIADAAERNIPRMMSSVRNLGRAIIDGIVSGLTQNQGGLFSQIWTLGSNLLDSFKSSLGIHSPSTEFRDTVGYMIDGLVVGVKKFGHKAFVAADNFAKEFVGNFDQVSQALTDAIQSDMDAHPVVTPVIDLSNFTQGTQEMSDLMANADLKTTVSAAGKISSSLSAQEAAALKGSDAQQVTDPSQPIQYIQNNYSPKALTQYEIYRQTQNQLKLAAKGVS